MAAPNAAPDSEHANEPKFLAEQVKLLLVLHAGVELRLTSKDGPNNGADLTTPRVHETMAKSEQLQIVDRPSTAHASSCTHDRRRTGTPCLVVNWTHMCDQLC